MSVNITISGGLMPPKFTSLSGTGRTTVYTVGNAKGYVIVGVNLYNSSGGGIACLLEYYDGTNYQKQDTVTPGASASARFTSLDSVPLRMLPNTTLHVTGNTNITVTVDAIFDSGTAPPTGGMGGAAHS